VPANIPAPPALFDDRIGEPRMMVQLPTAGPTVQLPGTSPRSASHCSIRSQERAMTVTGVPRPAGGRLPANETDRPGRRLLVVDDEAVQRLVVTSAAARAGFVADDAASLEAAVMQVRTATYDVVVLDLGLRKNDGIELLRRLCESGSDPVLVFISAFDERVRQAAARLAVSLGLRVAGTLGKPMAVDQLITLLRNVPQRAGTGHLEDVAKIDPVMLAAAIDRGEVTCAFQPKVTLSQRKLVGVEALARWHSPTLGTIPPNLFIPVAERSGLIDRLTWHVLDVALAACRTWRAACPDMTLAVNLSPLSLTDLALPERISDALAKADVPASALVLEVTETAVMTDCVAAADILTRLRIRDVKLSIDDFGTGHSSLLSLMRLPFSELKIDQSFVRDCLADPEAPKIIRGIVSVARELDLKLVAEGIETESVAELMEKLGCLVGQGYLFAPPLTAEALAARLRDAGQSVFRSG
jgi:EAL domain-containing protein (putative c-di-GMP-specific phosphodiesterase class I)/ActR/RegA family two-component response regulator